MAEILGTVVGVVSLGLQVASGISAYLDGIQGHKEDIDFTTRRSKSMETLLNQISSIRDRLPASVSAHSAALEQAMTQAKSELALLQDFISRISADNGSPTTSAFGKIRAQTKKVLYPFRRDHLNRLNSQLEAANKALSTGLQLAEMYATAATLLKLTLAYGNYREISINNDGTLRRLDTGLTDSHTTMINVERQIQENTSMLVTSRESAVTVSEGISEVKTMIMALMPPDSPSNGQPLFRGLMSKPDALRVACDNVGLKQPQGQQRKPSLGRASSGQVEINSDFECHCNFKSRRFLQRKRRHHGPCFLLQEVVTQNVHQIGCPHGNYSFDTDKSWSAGISVKAFQGLLSAAVTVTMSSAFGAGGFGVSPSITYYPLRDTSPAFKVIRVLKRALSYYDWTDEQAGYLVQRSIQSLKAVFSAKTSLPLDLCTSGVTLLEEYITNIRPKQWCEPQNTMLKFLVDMGVPKDRPNRIGRSVSY